MKDILSIIITVILSIAVIAGGILALVSMVGCNTFKVVQVEGQPDECNDLYTTMMFYAEQAKGKGGGDSAFIGTVYNECKTARSERRKALREKHCKDIIYGVNEPINKEDFRKYTHYLECSK
jgi:hypothetical protein